MDNSADDTITPVVESAQHLAPSETTEKHDIVTNIQIVTGPEKSTVAEAGFTPIKSNEELLFTGENEDSSNRRMSREDIETMEIMSKEEKRKEEFIVEKLDQQESAPLNGHTTLEEVKNDKRPSTSTPSSFTPRATDPILKQTSIFSNLSADDLIEYQWPPDDNGDYYMLQEQVSTFLGITSFKRKYPEIERRKLDPQEVKYLMTRMLVNEVQVTLGLTAVRSRDVCDLMIKEYPEKYHSYTQVLDEKQQENIKKKHLQYSAPTVEKSQMPNYLKKAMKQVSTYNARLNRQRKDDFAVYYDMQTNVLHFPKNKVKKADPEITKPSLYPCTLIPGQFQDFYQKYHSSELFYLPLNTAMYGPPAPLPDKLELIDTSASECESEDDSADTGSADNKSEKSQISTPSKPAAEGQAEAPVPVPSPQPDDSSAVAESPAKVTSLNETVSNEQESEVNEPKKETEESLMELDEDPEKPICGICLKDETCNKKGEYEDLISCSQCDNHGHPSCLDMSKDLVSVIVTYNWQCLECKTCTYCTKPHHEDKMMFCDRCDRGYHTFCVGLRNLPSGLWMCPTCTRSDPDFAKRGGRRGSTPRKRRASPTSANPSPSESPLKPKRKRRTKKEMEEAREKERIDREEKLKRKSEKKELKKKKKRERKAAAAAEKGENESKTNEDLDDSSILENENSENEENSKEDTETMKKEDNDANSVQDKSEKSEEMKGKVDKDTAEEQQDDSPNIISEIEKDTGVSGKVMSVINDEEEESE